MKNRYINTKFWDDNYVSNLDPIEKLLFIYFITNPLTNICGIYEVALKRIGFDTGIDKEMVSKILKRFEEDDKIKYEDGWIAIKNFIKHQKQSDNPDDKINKGIQNELENSPESLKIWINNKNNKPLEAPLKGDDEKEIPLADPSNYLNSNSNFNINSNLNIYNEIFEFWNSNDSLTHHSKLNDEMKSKIKKTLKNYSVDDIKIAIKNYAIILKDEKYYWDKKWCLIDFLSRGVYRFIDDAKPFISFQKGAKNVYQNNSSQNPRTTVSPDKFKYPSAEAPDVLKMPRNGKDSA